MRPLGIALLLIAMTSTRGVGQKTTFVGGGPTYTYPLSTFGSTNDNAYGGTVVYMSRKFCQQWFGFRMSFTRNVALDSMPAKWYGNQIVIAPEARLFFARPTIFPFYAVGNVQLSSIAGNDSASQSGLGLAGGLGYLLLYDADCCNWFLDLTAMYQAPNLLARDGIRPSLSSIVLALTFNISI